jgi:hypothetical protein
MPGVVSILTVVGSTYQNVYRETVFFLKPSLIRFWKSANINVS